MRAPDDVSGHKLATWWMDRISHVSSRYGVGPRRFAVAHALASLECRSPWKARDIPHAQLTAFKGISYVTATWFYEDALPYLLKTCPIDSDDKPASLSDIVERLDEIVELLKKDPVR